LVKFTLGGTLARVTPRVLWVFFRGTLEGTPEKCRGGLESTLRSGSPDRVAL